MRIRVMFGLNIFLIYGHITFISNMALHSTTGPMTIELFQSLASTNTATNGCFNTNPKQENKTGKVSGFQIACSSILKDSI